MEYFKEIEISLKEWNTVKTFTGGTKISLIVHPIGILHFIKLHFIFTDYFTERYQEILLK